MRLFIPCLVPMLVLSLLCTAGLWAQAPVSGYLVDAETQAPLAYAHVVDQATMQGTITNEEGYFSFNCEDCQEVTISLIAYEDLVIAVKDLPQNRPIALRGSREELGEVVITADDDYLYDMLDACARTLRRTQQRDTSKGYAYVLTQVNDEPLEYSESFFNAYSRQNELQSLTFKNGKAYLHHDQEGRGFVNVNLSSAFAKYSLLNGHARFPKNPFELSKKGRRRHLQLSLISLIGDVMKIGFASKKRRDDFFGGTIWMDKNSHQLQAISLDARSDPFGLFQGIVLTDIVDLHYTVRYDYFTEGTTTRLSHIGLNYDAKLQSIRGLNSDEFMDTMRHRPFNVATQSVLHFFDYGRPFFEPTFKVDDGMNDYRLFVLSSDEKIWRALLQTNYVKPTKEVMEASHYVKTYGAEVKNRIVIEPLDERKRNAGALRPIIYPWSDTARVNMYSWKRLQQDGLTTYDLRESRFYSPVNAFESDKIHIASAIYLDMIQSDSGLLYETKSIIDTYRSFNTLSEKTPVRCYINMHFDMVEIYRRRLEDKIAHLSDQAAILSIYEIIAEQLVVEQADLRKETSLGTNLSAMSRWNALIREELGIDNMKFFKLSEE